MNASELLRKATKSLKTDGLAQTLRRIATYPLLPLLQRPKQKTIFGLQNIEDRFTKIYELNYWGGRESISGVGSHLANTANLRANLPKLLAKYETKSIFDAPCGDFNWMKYVLAEYPLDYTGADIVAPLIESLNGKYSDDRTRFLHLDLTTHDFPNVDLMICRDCLFHLSYDDTRAVLRNFVKSRIPYLLTTTHINSGQIVNRDITTGAWRPIDLFSAPYEFPEEALFRINDSRAEDIQKEMCLWSRAQISEALTAMS